MSSVYSYAARRRRQLVGKVIAFDDDPQHCATIEDVRFNGTHVIFDLNDAHGNRRPFMVDGDDRVLDRSDEISEKIVIGQPLTSPDAWCMIFL